MCNCWREQSRDSGICSPLTYPSGFSKGSFSSIIRKRASLVVTFLSSSFNVILFVWNLGYRVLTLVKTYFCCDMWSKQGVQFFLVQESAKRNSRPSGFVGRVGTDKRGGLWLCNPFSRTLDISPSSKDCFISQLSVFIFAEYRFFSPLWHDLRSIMLPSRCRVSKVIQKIIQICVSTYSEGT